MAEENTGIGSAVPTFIESFIEQAEQGLIKKGYVTCSQSEAHIIIDLNAIEERGADGSINIKVFSLGGNKTNQNAQKITIFAKKPSAIFIK